MPKPDAWRVVTGPCFLVSDYKIEEVESDDPEKLRFRLSEQVRFVPPGVTVTIGEKHAQA